MTNFGISLSRKVLGLGFVLATMAACGSEGGSSEGTATGEERFVAPPADAGADAAGKTCNCQYRNLVCPLGTKADPTTPVTGTLQLPAPANGQCQGAYEYGPSDIDPDRNEKPGDGYNAAVAALCKKIAKATSATIGPRNFAAGDPESALGLVCGAKPGDPAPK